MSVALKIKDETANGELVSETLLHFPAEEISVRELICQRVKEEVDKYNKSLTGQFMGLIQPSDSEAELNGFKMKKNRPVNVEKQQQAALEAFGCNGFFLLVNDTQVTDLDYTFIITPKTQVGFIKLVPLVGG